MKNIRERIARAAVRAGRLPAEITLIAVTKLFGSEQIRQAIGAGVRDIGENYVQELLRKQQELAGEDLRWHFIGHLQSNKVKQVIRAVHLIHSVDSLPLGQEISKRALQAGLTAAVLVEVNTSGERSKQGVSPAEARELVPSLAALPGLRVEGLMTVGPLLPDPEGSRAPFRALRLLRRELEETSGGRIRLPHLSMGMTGDFEVAIEEGSTMVRIGTALFGPRRNPAAAVPAPAPAGRPEEEQQPGELPQ